MDKEKQKDICKNDWFTEMVYNTIAESTKEKTWGNEKVQEDQK